MPTSFNAPGVYVIEKDISEYPATINSSVIGVVGFASKGPPNKATLITSVNSLNEKFGKPAEGIYGQGLEGLVEIMETTDQAYFVRAIDDATAKDASGHVALGGCPAVVVSAGGAVNPAGGGVHPTDRPIIWGVTDPITFRIQVYDSNGVKQLPGDGRVVTVASGTISSTDPSSTMQLALLKGLGGGNDNSEYGLFASSFAHDTSTAQIVGAYAGSGAYVDVTACSGTAFNAASGVSALAVINQNTGDVCSVWDRGVIGGYFDDLNDASSLASSVRAWGSTFQSEKDGGEASSLFYLAESLHPGAGYNAGTTVGGDTSGNSVEISKLGGRKVVLTVNEDGAAKENFTISLVSGADYIEDVIQTGEIDLTSEIIKGNVASGTFPGKDLDPDGATAFTDMAQAVFGRTVATNIGGSTKFSFNNESGIVTTESDAVYSNVNSRYVKPIEGTYDLSNGNNGVPASNADREAALVGDATVTPKTGMQALDDDLLNISVGLVPGVSLQNVQNNLITLAERTQNFLAVVAPPYAVGNTQDAIDWHNGLSISRTASINNSYAAIYWPWVQVFSVFDRKDIWMDPAVYGARQMAFTDKVGETWFAPAGYQRGRLTKPSDVEVRVNRGDIATMYGGGNAINPIVNWPQQGITVWGNRTSQRAPTALDRINVRRLMIYIRKVLLLSTQRFVFEPNDQFLWAQIKAVVDPLMDDIANRRGITEFRVVCDETTNTPVRVDRNELWCRVLIKPTKAAEVLVFELNLTNQSADLGKL